MRSASRARRTAPFAGLTAGVCLMIGLASPPARAAFGIGPGSFAASTNQAPPAGSPPGTLGPLFTQAGGHPYSATTSFTFNATSDPAVPDQNVKDVTVDLPAGLIGDPSAVPQCSRADANNARCPVVSQVGVASLILNAHPLRFPVFNVVPSAGEPADFEFNAITLPVHIQTRVRTGGDYGLTTVAPNVSERLAVNAVTLTFWGVPADPGHDPERGLLDTFCTFQATGCATGGESFTGAAVKPFLTNPTFCGPPLTTTLVADPWQSPGNFITATTTTTTGPTGCGKLTFTPSTSMQLDTSIADSPSGLHVRLHIPQNDNPGGLAEPHMKKVTVTLPEGVTVNPAAANGLAACTPAEIDLSGARSATCPASSMIGSVEVDTPLIDHPLRGAVYVAQQGQNPFNSLIALYVAIHDPASGVVVKLAGQVVLDPQTGRLTTTFDNNPQLPFEDLKLDFFGGPQAALATPETCGTFETTSALSSWSAVQPGNPTSPETSISSDPFEINSGCVSAFVPSFIAGMLNPAAGSFSPFDAVFSRSDHDQDLGVVTVRTPPGLLGKIAGVPLCREPQAAAGTCSPASRIGRVTVAAGAGASPVSLPEPGKPQDPVFLTGPYKGAPFGLSVVVPAEAGPFNLGTVVVRAAIHVDPHTAQITIVSDPLPQILQGVPLKLRKVDVLVDHQGFMMNPTSCGPMTVGATIASAHGVAVALSSRFQAAGCASLPFKPTFAAATTGSANAHGASLDVKIAQRPGEAAIRKVDTRLPVALPSRLSTLHKACPEAQFAADPAGCPAGSDVGIATAATPILNVPLTGPAYLVSHGGAAFPDLDVVLQGEGVTIVLTGNTDIKKGITFSRFETVPDAPVSSFELHLRGGAGALLAASKNLCAPTKTSTLTKHVTRRVHRRFRRVAVKIRKSVSEALLMPTTIIAQNGAVTRQAIKIAVSGCVRSKRNRTSRPVKSK
jgi:hypothetical protein